MPRLAQALLMAFALVLLPARVFPAELLTLSPDNYAEYAPRGKEVDAIFGDYVLRNDRIVVVVADPALMVGRSGSRKYNPLLRGYIIDLTLRGAENDLLEVYDPSILAPTLRPGTPVGVPGEPHHQGDFVDEADAWKKPGRGPVKAARVALKLPFEPPAPEVRYTLEDGRPYVLVEMVYKNTGKAPLKLQPAGKLSLGPVRMKDGPDVLWGHAPEADLAWVYDRWFGQAYGIVGGQFRTMVDSPTRRPGWPFIHFVAAGDQDIVLDPGQSVVIDQKLFPAANALDARAIAGELRGVRQRRVRIGVKDPAGPVAAADLTVLSGRKVYGAGRTGPDGALAFDLPDGPYDLRVEPFGRRAQTIQVNAAEKTDYTVECEAGAVVAAEISDQRGGPIPCKIEFRGRDGTPDPFFFPATGEHLVQNLYHTQTGRFRQALPPGKYEVVITHGPEYDAVFQRIEVAPARETPLKATLARSVDTTGWISADFGNRSTVSRSFSAASPLGRALNLLAEHVEFAPPTESDFVSDFAPHLKTLGVERLMATCPGIGLTQRVRKTWTAQNAFPVLYKPGKQDGGALQRPQHVFQVFWLGGWYGRLTVNNDTAWVPATDKLIQETPPGIWPNDGRSDGMYALFYPRITTHEDPHRNGRLSALHYMDAMEVQPLDVFLKLPAYDPADPKGEKDLQAWWADLDARKAGRWPEVKDRNRDWPRMLNLGYRMTGVVNSNAAHNFHGSGGLRNFVKCPTDDPAAIKPLDVVHAVRFGHVVMSTGPFLDVSLDAAQKGKRSHGIPGDDVSAPGGEATLAVRVQGPNWIDVDRVQVIFNGMLVPALNFTRKTHADRFGRGTVKFDQRIPLKLSADTYVMVLVAGEGPNLRARTGPKDAVQRHFAVSNPIWADADGDGFKPHSPIDDAVYTYLDPQETLSGKPGAPPVRVRLYLKNLGETEAADTLAVEILPAGGAKVVGENLLRYKLQPGEQMTWDFGVQLQEGLAGDQISLHIPRSTVGVGRRAVGRVIKQDAPCKPWDQLTPVEKRLIWWLPEHVRDRPREWGQSQRRRLEVRER